MLTAAGDRTPRRVLGRREEKGVVSGWCSEDVSRGFPLCLHVVEWMFGVLSGGVELCTCHIYV